MVHMAMRGRCDLLLIQKLAFLMVLLTFQSCFESSCFNRFSADHRKINDNMPFNHYPEVDFYNFNVFEYPRRLLPACQSQKKIPPLPGLAFSYTHISSHPDAVQIYNPIVKITNSFFSPEQRTLSFYPKPSCYISSTYHLQYFSKQIRHADIFLKLKSFLCFFNNFDISFFLRYFVI